MNEQNRVEQRTSPEPEEVVSEETLAGVSGAGLGGAIQGWKAASGFGGDMTAKMKSAWYGLKKGKGAQTESYALVQVQQRNRQSDPFSSLTRTQGDRQSGAA
jgi:hypothetical protein